MRGETHYTPAWWVPGAHLRTMWGRLTRRRLTTPVRAERWTTPDDDLLDLRRLDPPAGAPATTPHLVFLHGLEGGVHSHYVANLFAEAERRGWGADLLLFRGCAGELNRARRFYHSGETTDFDFALRRIAAERPRAPIGLAGVSLGGNVLLKWLGERGDDGVPDAVRGAVAVSVPFDLARGCKHISRGFSRVYERFFLRSLVAKARRKLARDPDLCDPAALDRVRTRWDFDDVVTAPVHGAVAVSAPFDLARGSRHLSRGFSRVYERFFLRSLVAKARRKLARHPDLCDAAALERVRTLWDFDDVITAPVHGFRDALDYYTQSSSIHFLSRIRVPTLLLSAVDDPFLPPEVLEEVRAIAPKNPALELEFVRRGGHVGFVSGRVPWRPVYYAEWRVGDFLASQFGQRERLSSPRLLPTNAR